MSLVIEQIRRMRGGAQSHLMRSSDGHYYVVKFQNNPQHRRVLLNGRRFLIVFVFIMNFPLWLRAQMWLASH
jgi:hypothetical protein